MPRVLVTFPPRDGEREVVQEVLGDEAAWLIDGADPADAEVALVFWPRRELREAGVTWQEMPRLRLIQVVTAGVNHVGWRDLPTVPVAATPGATGPFIAEYVLGAVIAWARGFWRSTQDIAAGRFWMGQHARAVSELQIGVVGYGGLGQAVARTLASHGATVRAVSRSGEADDAARAHVAWLGTMERFEELVRQSDVLVLALPFNKETEGLVDALVLGWMTGREVLLVNVARGPIVVEQALFDWLQHDTERHHAVLDVWWRYPRDEEGHPYDAPLGTLPNVVMTPHNSPNVTGFRAAMVRQAAKQIRAYLDDGVPRHVHDPAWYETGVSGDERA